MIIDKKKGNLLMQGDDEEMPHLLSSLMLSTVKECDPDETDRNFCFQVGFKFLASLFSFRNHPQISILIITFVSNISLLWNLQC